MDHMARDIHTMTLDDWMLFRKVSSIVDNKLGTLVLHEEHLTSQAGCPATVYKTGKIIKESFSKTARAAVLVGKDNKQAKVRVDT
jgi:hypothetical protein